MKWQFVFIAMLLSFAMAARADTFTISDRDHVDDGSILDGDFADMYAGGGPLLEAGYMGGIYAEHHAATLIRFELRDCECIKVKSAELRLYKPKDFVQTGPVDVSLYPFNSSNLVSTGHGGLPEFATGNEFTWTSAAKTMHWDAKPIVTQRVGFESGWIKFSLPVEIVQKWRDNPDSFSGLYLAVSSPMQQWGDHVYFNSSSSFQDNGPELVLDGDRNSLNRAWIHFYHGLQPLAVSKDPAELQKWREAEGRLAGFTKDCAMSPDQSQLFRFFDTAVRNKLIVDRYQAPLQKTFDALDALIQKNDEAAVRTKLFEVRKTLLVWEYIRETSWYTSGPLADVLSPKQLAILFSQDIFGAMEQKDEKVEKGRAIRAGKDASDVKRLWEPIPADRLDAHIAATLADYQKRLELSLQQLAEITPGITEDERRENEYVGKFRHDLDHVRELLKAGHDDDEMLDTIRQMHRDHELFLYYQSIYDTPRWNLLMAKVPVIPFAKWIVHTRKKSDRETAEAEEREDVKAFNATTQPK